MKTAFCILSLLVVLQPGVASSQPTPAAQNSGMPAGPMIQRKTPEFSSWTKTTTVLVPRLEAGNPVDGSPNPGSQGLAGRGEYKVRETTRVTRTGKTWHIEISDSMQAKREIWVNENIQVVTSPDWKDPLISTGENAWDAARFNLSSGGFSEFDWIGDANFSGTLQFDGRDCLVFKGRVFPSHLNPEDLPRGEGDKPVDPDTYKVPAVAYTDLATRLPVALIVGDEVTKYKFDQPPSAPLTLPEHIAATIKDEEMKYKNLIRRPSRP